MVGSYVTTRPHVTSHRTAIPPHAVDGAMGICLNFRAHVANPSFQERGSGLGPIHAKGL